MSTLSNKHLVTWILPVLLTFGPASEATAGEPTASRSAEAVSAAQAPSSAPDGSPSVLAGYDRGFVLRSPDGKNSLRFVGLVQVQHAHAWLDGAPGSGALQINRARAGVIGNLFDEDLRYLLVAELGKRDVQLLYASLDYTLIPGGLSVRAGQFKRPFSRSFLTSSSQLSMIDRPLPVGAFGDDSDIGLMVHNGDTQPFEYAVGLFSGGLPGEEPDPVHPVVAVRVAGKTGGLKGYTESDLEGGAPRFGVGAAVVVDLEADAGLPARGLVDGLFKAHGFSLSSAIYVRASQDGEAVSDRRLDAVGHYTQAGYVIADRVEPVVRYAFLMPVDGEGDTHDVSGGLNLFFRGHALKLQTNVGVREVLAHPVGVRDSEKTRDVYVTSQLTLAL
ncbi:MAG: porin [Myxococcota bacterium]